MPSRDNGPLGRQVAKLRLARRQILWLAGLVALGLALQWGVGEDSRDMVSIPLAVALAWAALIDLDRLRLPDVITLPLIVFGIAWAFESGRPAPEASLIGAMSGYGVFAGLAWAYRRFRGYEGLGLGDAKLFAAAGAWLGWVALPLVALIASGAGLAAALIYQVGRKKAVRNEAVAFGPFIAAGFWAVWLLSN